MRSDFAVFILTHGRPHDIPTVKALERGHYSGRLYFLLDNEDETKPEYEAEYGAENILVFDKERYFQTTDTMDTTGERKAIVFARRAVFDVARELGLSRFLMLEDDFTAFMYRFADGEKLMFQNVLSLDDLFSFMVDFLDESNALTVCFAQGGDFIGGVGNQRFKAGLLRKTMNTFFCRTDRPIDFRGTMNEDVTAYTNLGSRGELFFSFSKAHINQKTTQSLEGGMTEVYRETGTYQKSFYSVMSQPSSVKIAWMGQTHKRIHHIIDWKATVPMILNERWKK